MKSSIALRGLSSIVWATVCLVGCREIGPNINLRNNANAVSDTTYVESAVATPEIKNVIIEEFTGVRCPNCPQGHQIIANIKAAHNDRVVSVSLHPINSLGIHYSFSADTFQNASAQSLFDELGQIGLEPAAAIDRIPATSSSVLFEKNSWVGKVDQQLTKSTPVNLQLTSTYDSSTREVTIVMEAHYTEQVTPKNKVTMLLTETDIVSAQLNGSVIDTFYVHKDVQRAFVSSITGDLLDAPLDAGRVFVKVYKTTLASKWNPEKMHVLSYIHEFENNSRLVYQAREIKVK